LQQSDAATIAPGDITCIVKKNPIDVVYVVVVVVVTIKPIEKNAGSTKNNQLFNLTFYILFSLFFFLFFSSFFGTFSHLYLGL